MNNQDVEGSDYSLEWEAATVALLVNYGVWFRAGECVTVSASIIYN